MIVPKAIFRAWPSCLLSSNSPKIVPPKCPIIVHGYPRVTLLRNDPSLPPNVPNLLVLYFLDIIIGAKKSNTNVSSVTTKNTMVVIMEILLKPVPIAKINSPNQAMVAPGMNGRMVLAKPIRTKIVLMIANIIVSIKLSLL